MHWTQDLERDKYFRKNSNSRIKYRRVKRYNFKELQIIMPQCIAILTYYHGDFLQQSAMLNTILNIFSRKKMEKIVNPSLSCTQQRRCPISVDVRYSCSPSLFTPKSKASKCFKHCRATLLWCTKARICVVAGTSHGGQKYRSSLWDFSLN